MKWLSKVEFWFTSRPLRRRLSAIERSMKYHPTKEMRLYYAQTAPARARFRSALEQALLLPQPQRCRFICHLAAEWYSLSASFPLWLERACEMDLFPYNTNAGPYYGHLTNDRVRKNLQIVRVLIDRFNKVYKTEYREADFTNLPISSGVQKFIRLCQLELDNSVALLAEHKLPESKWIEPFEVLHFELEFMSLQAELDIVANQTGESMESVVIGMDGMLSTLGLGHWVGGHFGKFHMEPSILSNIAVTGLDCLTEMVETAKARSV